MFIADRLESLLVFHSVLSVLRQVIACLLKRDLHRVRSSASYFNFLSLRLLPRLILTFVLSCTFSSMMCFRREFLTHDVTNQVVLRFTVRVMLVSSSTLCSNSHNMCKRSPSFSSTTFKNFTGIYNLLSEVSKFVTPYKALLQMQHFNSFFLKLSPVCWCKVSSSC